MTLLLTFFRNLLRGGFRTGRTTAPLTGPLSHLRLGISWDETPWDLRNPQVPTDLDVDALLYSADGALIDTVSFDRLRSLDGSVVHAGDAVTAEDAGPDDQHVRVHLDAVPAEVTTIVFVLTAHHGQDFRHVTSTTTRIVDGTHGVELARFTSTEAHGEHTAVLVAKLFRTGPSWSVTILDEPADEHLAASLAGVAAHP